MTRPVGTATWGGIGRSRGDRARLADRHFTSCREGGGSRGNGLLQVADVLEEHLFLIINALSYPGQPGAQLVHLHSGAQAAWRSPMWSTADVCRRERRQSSELRTGFLLKATHGPPLHTAWERAGYMAAPNFNRSDPQKKEVPPPQIPAIQQKPNLSARDRRKRGFRLPSGSGRSAGGRQMTQRYSVFDGNVGRGEK
ncbi:uncharacterized protein LOC129619803 isoform X2 [Bubalus kerabau]|uniref:uncharacterized protein LOC129619803 isoform X2 n=1 Tax=Bubalus carabanensis TaxID=3119969 RepID=UPI00244E94E2|nr:uncharacterized protein LOC129619803 isoform X2 [Bubalus carabanensis]